MWSGASIDHFQVVFLAAAAIACVARNTRRGVLLGAAFATLATYTLAHGLVTWAVGAVMLLRIRNRAGLLLWCAVALLVVGTFLYGFQLNRSQGFATLSLSGALLVAQYWLTLLGSVPALGANGAAPWFGVGLLLVTLWLALIRTSAREKIAFAMLLFAIGALTLIAIGRAQHSGGVVFSRYYVLGAVAWAMMLFMVITRWSHPRRPLAALVWLVPVLATFNVAANRTFVGAADSWVECRDRAVVRYLQHGVDGRGEFVLHPAPTHSTRLLQQAEQAGIYRMPSICLSEQFPAKAKPSTRLFYFVDALTVDPRAVYVTGWAALDKIRAERGEIKLVLRSGKETRIFTTVSETRPDVAKATRQSGWAASGFQFVARRERLPAGEFNIGFLIEGPDGPEFSLTAHRVNLIGEGKALLASGD